ncbi:hypothetical protein [Petropleomorpha daqingensis]|uniref:Membrane protein YfhO n=1 Tax=Petropleomorpha daqingensis TaxID=2026353 RepID=A0A853CAD0_9ACTN|nr:hypothetical protein [Petropleomorpha daqingensis]NYJ04624.1 hypothetical protein [Petropleomorpha daqingensis]
MSAPAVLDHEAAAATGPDGGDGATGPRSVVRDGWRAAGLFAGVEAVFLLLVHWWQPRFFYFDDLQAQYIPAWRWMGEHLTSGGPPLIDPDQGSAGAWVADLQYGVLDPLHWLLALVVSHVDNLNLVAWGLKLLVVVVLGLGTTVLATHLGARPLWAAAAAVGAANSGFMLWFATSWWPAGWGTAWLPWLWWGLSSRSRWSVPVAVVAAYALVTSGYPYALPFTGIMVVSVVGMRLLRPRAAEDVRALVVRVVAAAGGALLGSSGLLTASALTPFSQRSEGGTGDPFGNAGTYIPNLLDVLLGGNTTSPSVVGWWGDKLPPPVMATAWFVLPVLALIRWKARPDGLPLWRARGVVPAAVLCAVAVAATQTPTVLFDLRYPFRYVVVLQVTLPLLVAVLASRCGLVLTLRRLLLAAVLLLAQGGLALSRTPVLWKWHALAIVLGLGVLAVVALSQRSRSRRPAAAGEQAGSPGRVWWQRAGLLTAVLMLAATALAPLASIGTAIGYQRVDARAAGAEPTGLPARGVYDTNVWPSLASDFEAASQGVGLNATVIWWGDAGMDRGALRGAAVGNAALLAGIRPGYGYTSLGQAGWADRWCADFVGQVTGCPDPVSRLLEQVPGTDLTWLEALSKDVVLLDERAPAEIRAAYERSYQRVGDDRGFLRYERIDPTPGRITWTSPAVTSVEAVTVGEESESYRVSWDGDDARLFARIPWWPGYEATLDGKPVDLQVVDRTALMVALPAGHGDGILRIEYHRPRATLGLLAVGAGAIAAVAALAAAVFGVPRFGRSRTPAG